MYNFFKKLINIYIYNKIIINIILFHIINGKDTNKR